MVKSEQLGDIVIDRIVESVATFFQPARFFDEALPEAIEPYRSWLEQSGALDPVSGNMIMPIQSYLIRTPTLPYWLIPVSVATSRMMTYRNGNTCATRAG